MGLLNASLLLGALFVAVPIVLHMTMRPRPKRLLFPAIRLVAPRQEANQRRLNWKRWMLLALRCGLIVLLALALARPTVGSQLVGAWLAAGGLGAVAVAAGVLAGLAAAQGRGRWLTLGLATVAAGLLLAAGGVALAAYRQSPGGLGHQADPVAAVLLFDTSPRMAYRLENRQRLEQASETARWIISQLPAESEVAVLDSRSRNAVFSVDPSAAAKSVERLDVTYVPRPLSSLVADGVRLARSSVRERRELYLFTDMNARAWRDEAWQEVRNELQQGDDVAIYVIDVGVDQPRNVGCGELRLSSELVPRDGELAIDTELRSTGFRGERIVELYLEQPDLQRPLIRDGQVLLPESQQRGRQACTLSEDGAQPLQFRVKGLPPGVHHGRVKVLGQDALSIDDERYFAVQVQEAWPLLLAAGKDASLRFVAESLAPYEMREQGTARFDCVQARVEDLANYELEQFAAVVLLDPPPLADEEWQRLAAFVRSGHGLAIVLGSQAGTGEEYSGAAEQLLAGHLARVWRTGGRDVFLSPSDYQHPVTAAFRDIATNVPWNLFPVFRHWDLEPLAADAHAIVRFNNGRPALLERPVGSGKVVTVTTPLSDTARPPGRASWNELAFGENPWPQFILVNELLLYLVSSGEQRLNYLAGQPAVLPRREQVDPERFQLFPPRGEPYDVLATERAISVRFTELPGAYRLKGNRGGIVQRGFAVNVPLEASDLERAPREVLAEALGEGRAQVLRDRQQIERAQGRQRVGREFYPLLMLLVALVLGLEQTTANRFYRRSEV